MIHQFTLIVENGPELTDQVTDALFEAGCDDALVGSRDGHLFLDFDREADSKEMAVQSAVSCVESAGIGGHIRVIAEAAAI